MTDTAAAAGPRYRWKLGANISNDGRNAERDVALLASIGGRVARISLEDASNPTAAIAPYVKACDAHGVELYQCSQTPGHVVPKSQKAMDAYASDVAEYASFARRTSTGNEVSGFGSNETPNPRGQAEILLAAADAVAKFCPGRRLASPSTCPGSGKVGQQYVEPLLFMDALFQAEPTVLAIPNLEMDWHGYGPFGQLVDAPESLKTWNTAYRTAAFADDLSRLGYPKMRISWSEYGEPVGNGGKDAAFQAQQFDHYLALLASPAFAHVNMGELCWYLLRDDGQSGWPGTCGLFDIHGNEKPVVARFKIAAALLR